MSEARSYPRHAKTDAGEIEFRLMSRADEAAVLAFAKGLPTHDRLARTPEPPLHEKATNKVAF